MKKMLTLIVSVIMLISILAFPANAAPGDTGISPCAIHLSDYRAKLSISSGTATYSANAESCFLSDTITVTVALQRLVNGSWEFVSNCTSSGTGSASASRSQSVTSGYSYRAYATIFVQTSSGQYVEQVSAYSSTVNY